MSESRKIVINETLFSSTGGGNKTKKKNNKSKNDKPKPVIKPNSLKKTLLEKIKRHQQHEKMTKDKEDKEDKEDKYTNATTKRDDIGIENKDYGFHDNFMNSLEYLNKLSEKNKQTKKEKQRKNKTLKNHSHVGSQRMNIQAPSEPLVSIELPSDFDNPPYSNTNNMSNMSSVSPYSESNTIVYQQHQPIPQPIPDPQHHVQSSMIPTQALHTKPDAPYGCLKGGNKPTFRQYHNKTLKRKPISIQSNNSSNNNLKPRQQILADLKKSYKKFRQRKRTIKKRTYNLGKTGGKVSILIKNNTTQRKIKREHGLLKQKSMVEIKKDLYDRNLIKFGSTAPNDVLRILYEQSILAGDINNTSSDIQLHNFMNK